MATHQGLLICLFFFNTADAVLFLSGEELIEEIKLVREERKQLEWTRQELLRKGKDLLAQNRHRRNQGELKTLFGKKLTFYKASLQVLTALCGPKNSPHNCSLWASTNL